jgi:hypothetical protein
LWIEVDEEGSVFGIGEACGEADRGGRFTDSPLLVCDGNYFTRRGVLETRGDVLRASGPDVFS